MKAFETDMQLIDLSKLDLPGQILDIGGGGEGVITRCFGGRVTAIDTRQEELDEIPDTGRRIVMDARDMAFPDNSFDTVTAFYSLMYMSGEAIPRVFAETYRVLRPGGRFYLWDTVIPAGLESQVFLARLEVMLPHGQRLTPTFGIGWTREQSMALLQPGWEKAGFACLESRAGLWAFGCVLEK